jgi:hypothetical protein
VGAEPAGAVVLDAGALIAMERLDRRVLALCATAREADQHLVVPAGVVGQVWRDGSRQARLARFLRARGTVIQALDLGEARSAGIVCGRAGTSDVIDATVVLAARRHQARVVSSDRGDLHRLDGDLYVIDC